MKKFYTLSLLLVGVLSFGQASDAFVGTGSLNANGWISHSGSTPGQVSIVPGSLTYAGLTSAGNKTQTISGNTEDVSLTSAATLTSVGYYSAVMNVLNTTGLMANTAIGDYPLMFGSNSIGGSPTFSVFAGRLFVRTGSVANTFNIGILNISGGTVTPSYSATDFPVGTSLFVVVKYTPSTNTANLWINPAIGSAEGASTLTNATGTTLAPTQLERLAIRQATNTGNIEIDEVRIGSTWAYVTGSVLSIQQNSISGLKVYPNPAKDVLYISSDNNTTKQVEVYDVLGKVVLNTKATNAPINIASLNRGVYVVKVTEEGKTATRKLVIE
jgi:Secretion system C-terminal sorting domain